MLKKSHLAVVGLVVGGAAQAAGPDYSSLTGAVDMSTTIGAILAIAAISAGVNVVQAGARRILGMLKRA